MCIFASASITNKTISQAIETQTQNITIAIEINITKLFNYYYDPLQMAYLRREPNIYSIP